MNGIELNIENREIKYKQSELNGPINIASKYEIISGNELLDILNCIVWDWSLTEERVKEDIYKIWVNWHGRDECEETKKEVHQFAEEVYKLMHESED